MDSASAIRTAAPVPAPGVRIGERRIPQAWLDIVFAVGLALVGFLETTRNANIPPGATGWDLVLRLYPVALITISGLSLGLRRHFPLAVMVLTAAALQSQDIDETGSGWIAMMAAAFSAGLQPSSRGRVIVAFAIVAAVVLGVWALAIVNGTADPVQPLIIGLVVAFWWVGNVMRERAIDAAELQARTIRLELEREHEAERAATAERARIARELHDVIAHSLSVVVIQAAAAKRVLATDPERARESLDAVEQTGRSAMLEMRRLLGVVRRDETEAGDDRASGGAPRVPQPSLGEVRRLVDEMRAAGVDVTLRVEGEEQALPSGVDVSGYRIVQEALTNASRHAPSSRTVVVMRYGVGELEIRVENDAGSGGGSGSADASRAPGHGLAGMRERVSLLRGELEVGPRPDGGFIVHARLPLDDGQAGPP